MNKIEKQNWIIASLLMLSVVISIPIIAIVYAQTPTQKSFYLGTDPSTILDEFRYSNGDEIQASIGGYPPITITVSRWNELSTATKTLITTKLTTNGYIEGEEVLTDGLLN